MQTLRARRKSDNANPNMDRDIKMAMGMMGSTSNIAKLAKAMKAKELLKAKDITFELARKADPIVRKMYGKIIKRGTIK